MASFQAKMGQDSPGMREKKIIIPISSKPIRNKELQKYSKKIQKHQYGLF